MGNRKDTQEHATPQRYDRTLKRVLVPYSHEVDTENPQVKIIQ